MSNSSACSVSLLRPGLAPAVLAATLALSGCSATGGGSRTSGGGGEGGGGEGGKGATSSAATGTGGAATTGSGGFSPIGSASSSGAGGSEETLIAEVYGHSPKELYRLDPDTKGVEVVGPFQGCDEDVIDIALDKDSNLFGTTYHGLFRIDRETGKCTKVASGDFPNSLSFVPAGTVDAGEEALVGYLEDDYVRIDTDSGSVQKIGALSGGPYISSGDIVSVKGGSTLLTVKGGDCGDCLVEVNPKTGALVKNYGKLSQSRVFGLAFWAGRAYGFAESGVLFEIAIADGGISTTPIPVPGAPSGLKFWGAGSTTSAPPKPVPK